MSKDLVGKGLAIGAGLSAAIAVAIKSSLKGFLKGAFKLDVENWDDSYIDEVCLRSKEELENSSRALRALISGTEEGSAEHELGKILLNSLSETNEKIPDFGESIKAGRYNTFLSDLNEEQAKDGTSKFLNDTAKFDYKVFTQDELNNPERKKELITHLKSCFPKHGTPITEAIRDKQVTELVNNIEDITNIILDDPETPAHKNSILEETVDLKRMGTNLNEVEIKKKAVHEKLKSIEEEKKNAKKEKEFDPNADSIYSNDSEEPSGP